MALADFLSSFLTGGQGGGGGGGLASLFMGQSPGGVDPGQSVSGKSAGNMPLSQLIAQNQSQDQAPMASGGDLVVPGKSNGPPTSQVRMAPPSSQPQMAGGFNPNTIDPGTGDQSPQGTKGINYNNSDARAAVDAAVDHTPPGGSANPGLYGILPANLQHGTLRNTLGAISDAFLVQGGSNPDYANNMARQRIGEAMAGVDYNDPQSVAAAMQRVGATGSPGSIQAMDAGQKNFNDLRLRQAEQENLNNWRTGNLYEKNQNLIRQSAPQMQNYLAQATSKEDYAQRLQYVKSRIQGIDPSLNAEAELNVPSADQWTPALMKNLGVTGAQNLTATTSTNNNIRSTNQSGENAATAAGARVASARIMAGSRSQPLDNQLVGAYRQAQASGQPMDAGTAIAFDRRFGTPTNPHPSQTLNPAPVRQGPPVALTGGNTNQVGSAVGGGYHQPFQEGRIYTDANGNHATYHNGKFVPHR